MNYSGFDTLMKKLNSEGIHSLALKALAVIMWNISEALTKDVARDHVEVADFPSRGVAYHDTKD